MLYAQVMYRSAVKKISDLVSHFAVAHNYGTVGEAISNIVAQIGARCPIKVCEHFTAICCVHIFWYVNYSTLPLTGGSV